MVLLFGSGRSHDDLPSVLQNFLHEWVDGSHELTSAEYGTFRRDTGGLAQGADVDHG